MTPEERRRRMQVILDQHDQMAREFREALEASRQSTTHSEEASAAIHAMTAQIRDMAAAGTKALTAMIAANEAALALWNDPEDQRS